MGEQVIELLHRLNPGSLGINENHKAWLYGYKSLADEVDRLTIMSYMHTGRRIFFSLVPKEEPRWLRLFGKVARTQ